ncbi:MAG: hypothetical protein JW712_03040 [Dehalococcoidales bacterium]|nr:hypothetical protein [Dehalococcoidales bacterium]
MELTTIINCSFGWFLVVLALVGYYLTYKKIGERWSFWFILALGWSFFALTQTLVLAGAQAEAYYIVTIWLCSYVLVSASMILLFLKLVGSKVKKTAE